MFDIGFSELVVIALVALIVLGPQRLQEVARTAGKWAGQARRFMDSVKADFEREIASPELEQFRKLQQEMSETRNLIEAPVETLIEPAKSEPAPPVTQSTAPVADEPAIKVLPSPEMKPAPAKPKARRTATAARPKSARKKHGATTKRTAG